MPGPLRIRCWTPSRWPSARSRCRWCWTTDRSRLVPGGRAPGRTRAPSRACSSAPCARAAVAERAAGRGLRWATRWAAWSRCVGCCALPSIATCRSIWSCRNCCWTTASNTWASPRRIPKVAYGIDSLFSFYHNMPKNALSSGLIISSGYQCTHILPILEGRLDAKNCKRINLGGSQAAGYLQRLLQLKYPGHLAAITLSRMEEILQEHSYIAEDYGAELQKWRCPDYYENNVHKMQLPFSSKLLGSTLTAEEKQERRQQQLRRLQELNARRREEKLQLDQERLERLLYVQELLEDGQMDQFHKALIELNMDSPEELQSYIQKLTLAVEQAKQKILQAEASLEVDVVDSKPEVTGPGETPDLEQLEPSLEDVESINDFEPLFSEEAPEVEKPVTTVQPVFNLAAYHQLFVGTERIRAPEIIFQPSLIGEEQAGIAETLHYVLDRYPKAVQDTLVQNVFLTGGNVMYPGMKARMEKELLEMRPFQSSFQVQLASNPVLDAWYGARDWALDHLEDGGAWVTRKDYEEKGGEYLKEHCASNTYVPIRLPKQASRASETQTSGRGSGATGSGAGEQA
ncbi:actin-related protein 5 isoform X3 [Peromyscus californicus insignis]|uniref:actin-related protein 5 isoform X3 n=1 Tax=Peromyscus californicus insignis TaxID=564181 RepID=UPI0022A79C3C|nr:actin-related protein 5 isoform X3 [Peromyscus californicus insignis]